MRPPSWLALCAAACASAAVAERQGASTDVVKTTIAPQETIDLTRQTTMHAADFAATRDQVWTAVLGLAENLGMAVQSADPTAGVVVYYLQAMAPYIGGKPASAWVDCGIGPSGGPRADTYQITLRVTAVVEAGAKNQTRVRVMLVGFARDRGMSTNRLPCTSTGGLEPRTLAAVAARLSP